MIARQYEVRIHGETPLLLHNDNLEWAEVMKRWALEPDNRKNSVAGDDRSPAFRWIGCLYVDGGKVVIPADNLMTVLREGGKKCPTGKGQQTFKSQTQSGIVVDQASWSIIGPKGEIPYAPIKELMTEEDFSKHEAAVRVLGFELFPKRARINGVKHVRVRPRFDSWSASGTVTVFDEMITEQVLRNILDFAGRYAGVGDWRPSSPKSPGPFGKFTVEVR